MSSAVVARVSVGKYEQILQSQRHSFTDWNLVITYWQVHNNIIVIIVVVRNAVRIYVAIIFLRIER